MNSIQKNREAREAFKFAHKLMDKVLDKYLGSAESFPNHQNVKRDSSSSLWNHEQESGLKIRLQKYRKFERKGPMERILTWETTIVEQGPAMPDNDLLDYPENQFRERPRFRWAPIVPLRERHDNIIEAMAAHKKVLQEHGGAGLQRGTTKLLEGDSLWENRLNGSVRTDEWRREPARNIVGLRVPTVFGEDVFGDKH